MRLAPPPPSSFSGFLRLATALAIVLASRGAHAADPVVNNIIGEVTRLEPDGESADALGKHPHPGGVGTNALNYEDCAANLRYHFVLSVTGTATQFVAYAGTTDCTAIAARTGASPTCWAVTPQPIPQTVGQTQLTVDVRMQDLAAQSGITPTSSAYPNATSDACNVQPTSAGTTIFLYFFFVDQFQNAIGIAQAYPVLVDTQAATVSAAISIIDGDDSLQVSIPANNDSDITGWNLYCDPPRGEESEQNFTPIPTPTPVVTCPDAEATASSDASHDASSTGTSSDASGETLDDADGEDSAIDAFGEDSSIDSSSQDSSAGSSNDASSDASDASSAVSDAGAVSDAQAVDAATVACVPTPTGHDDAGGSPGGISINEAGIETTLGCNTTAFAASTIVPVDDAGTDEAGTALSVSVDAGTSGKAQTQLPAVYLCGQAAAGSTSGTINGLVNGVYYTVALAATDAVGNVGPVATACGLPISRYDFIDEYYGDHGSISSGYCSIDGVGVPAGTSALGILFAAGCAAAVRRRRRA